MYTGKTGGGDEVPSPFPPLVSPPFFFLCEFFSRALLSERLEQASQAGAFQQMKNQTPGSGCNMPFSKIQLGYTGMYGESPPKPLPIIFIY